MAAYGSMHGTLAGSGTVVRDTAQRRNSHNHRPCATRRGGDKQHAMTYIRATHLIVLGRAQAILGLHVSY
eukprot:5035787-Prymnesium_polylepis.1